MIRYINKIIFTLSLATLFLSAAQAQEPVQTTEHPKFKADEQIDNTESARVASRSNLVADKANRTFESGAIDSMLMEITAEAEEMMFPADELYGEDWNNEHVKAYGDKLVPNNYTIDVSEFAMPANGHVTSRFGWRKRRMHNGIDIKVQTGEPIRAAFDGKIRVKKYQRRGLWLLFSDTSFQRFGNSIRPSVEIFSRSGRICKSRSGNSLRRKHRKIERIAPAFRIPFYG